MSKIHTLMILLCSLAACIASERSSARGISGPEASLRCKSMSAEDFSKIPDALTQVTQTAVTEAGEDAPAFCEVSGYVTPQVGIVLRLPAKAWNGKFIELGCGGFCGSLEPSECNPLLRRGYACLVSDFGHRATIVDAKWAFNNIQAEIDYGYRGAHVVALAGKAIIERYYGHRAKYSYFVGSSTGGRQALMEAQRFPWDFEGIIASSPWPSDTGGSLNLLWVDRALHDSAGAPLMQASDLELLHQAALKHCDLDDGVKDGVIGNPQACAFDPRELRCAGSKRLDCLTNMQVVAAQKVYNGATTSDGHPIYLSGAMRGSERNWYGWYLGPGRFGYAYSGEEFRYCLFDPDPGSAWRPQQFDFDSDYKRLGLAEGLYDPINPDLRRFKATGGKLLAYAGWNDAAGMPLHSADYYEMVEKAMGGRGATQDFFRLFMVPGMEHGPNGDGATVVDWLSYLEAWVEDARAPDKVMSYRLEGELTRDPTQLPHQQLDESRIRLMGEQRYWAEMLKQPLSASRIELTRPVYPYPILAKYRGRGDPNDASSFGPVVKH